MLEILLCSLLTILPTISSAATTKESGLARR